MLSSRKDDKSPNPYTNFAKQCLEKHEEKKQLWEVALAQLRCWQETDGQKHPHWGSKGTKTNLGRKT